ncbi:MAG: hypothetical protein OEZ04_06245 [Nitrospinota bacterium]|nr:hypothetical protein [Nitrospinota bacterium]
MDNNKSKEKPGVHLLILMLVMVSITMFGSVVLIVKYKEFFKKFIVPE